MLHDTDFRLITEDDIRQACAKPPRDSTSHKRASLTSRQRAVVLAKTAGTCHVCGISLGARWHADHIVPHVRGGTSTVDNCLAICAECNGLRWSYPPAMFRMIIRLGILAKQEVRYDTPVGRQLMVLLASRLRRNSARRKPRPTRPSAV